MTFLNPAVLFGLIAASIPVLIHLLNLRKLKTIEFSTLMFLKELQKNKIKRVKIKQWILLALRVLIILFIVLSFSRPTVKGTFISGTTSAAKTSAVIILDDTYSMAVVGNNGSYLNKAKRDAGKILSLLQEGDEAVIIKVSEAVANDFKFTGDLQNIQKQLSAINPSYAGGNLNSAIVKASSLLSNSKNFNKEIYIFSDFQKGGIFKEKELLDLSSSLNESVKLFSFNYNQKEVYNLSVDNLEVASQIFEINKPVRFTVRVKNHSTTNYSNRLVSLFINNEKAAQQSFSISAGENKNISLEAVLKKKGNNEVYAVIDDDDIVQDNKRFNGFYVPENLSVLIVAGNQSEAVYVQTALQAVNSGDLNVTLTDFNRLQSIDVSKFNSLFIIAGNGLNTTKLKNYIAEGKGIIIAPSVTSDANTVNRINKELSLPSVKSKMTLQNGLKFSKTDFEHPLFKDLFLPGENKKFESPEIKTLFTFNSFGQGKEVIALSDGSSFLTDFQVNKGRILYFNTPLEITASDFPFKGIFPLIILKSVYYTSSIFRDEKDVHPGENIFFNTKNYALDNIEVVKPDGNKIFFNSKDFSNGMLDFNETYLPGLYKFVSANKYLKNIPVNTDPSESITEYSQITDFENYLNEIKFSGKYKNYSPDEDAASLIMQARFGSELWKLFLLLALICAVAEMYISKNTKHEIDELKMDNKINA